MPILDVPHTLCHVIDFCIFCYTSTLQVFTSSLVKDKFEKHLIMMEQNGLSRWTYWLVTYTFNYILYIPVAVEICVLSFVFKMRLFTQVHV